MRLPSRTRTQLCSVESLRLGDGRQLCVRRWRRKGMGTLVVLHGLLDSSEGWSALSARLSCEVVAFDLPGFGCSDPPARASIAAYAQDVADGLELLGLERFTLVGHSLGGAVATTLAELVPEKVAGLVLLAPVGFGRMRLAELASLPVVRTLLQTVLPWALRSRVAVRAAFSAMVTNGRLPDPEVVDRVTRNGRSLVDGTRTAVRAIADAGRCAQAAGGRRVAYRGPVAAVWGDRDRLVPPEHRHGLLAALPQARIQLWEDMGHHPAVERLDELVVLLASAAPARSARATSSAA